MPQVLISIVDPKLKSEVTGLVSAAALAQTSDLQKADLAVYELGKFSPPRTKTPFVFVTDHAPNAENYKTAIREGANDLLELPKESAGLLQKLSDLENYKQTRAKTIGIISGSGGAGASTIASLAAWGLRRKFQTVLVDLIPDGGGLDVIFAQESNPASRWGEFENSQGEIPVKTFQSELINIESLSLMSYGRDNLANNPQVNRKVLNSLLQAFELAIVDVNLSNLNKINFHEVILICTNTVRSVAASMGRLEEIIKRGFNPKLIVRELPGGDVAAEKISQSLNIALAGEFPHDPQLQKDLDRGNFIHSRSKSFKTVSLTFEKFLTL